MKWTYRRHFHVSPVAGNNVFLSLLRRLSVTDSIYGRCLREGFALTLGPVVP